jgi:hypothetical protein
MKSKQMWSLLLELLIIGGLLTLATSSDVAREPRPNAQDLKENSASYSEISDLSDILCFDNEDCNVFTLKNYCCKSMCCAIFEFIAQNE